MSDSPVELPSDLAARYRVTRELGRGAFGCVLLATRREDDAAVAIKLLVSEVAQHGDVRERFSREGRAGSRVDHPNVVRVIEVGSGDTPFLVQEFVTGGSLEERIAAHPEGMDPREAARVLDGILAGLQAAHQQGLTHRDLKPANILLDDQGRPKLADFGLAHGAFEATLTATGTILGTPLYMAPGQVLGEKPGPSWDVYAAAAIYYEMLLGRPPFDGKSLVEILDAKQRGLVAGLGAEGVPVSPAVDKLLRVALGSDHAAHHPDVVAFRKAWAEVQEPEAAEPDTQPRRDPREPERTAILGAAPGSTSVHGVAAVPGGTSARQAPVASKVVPERPEGWPVAVRVAAGVGLLLALGVGWRMGSPAPEPVPPPEATSSEMSSLEELRVSEELATLRSRMMADPQVRQALDLEGQVQPETLQDDFQDAQQAVENMLEVVDIPALLERIEGGLILPPKALDGLLDVVGIQHLLSRAKFGELAEDTGGPRQRAIDRAFRRLVRMRRVEDRHLPPSSRKLPKEGIRHTREDEGEESTWQLLRGYHNLEKHVDDRKSLRPNNRVWRHTPRGKRFENPVDGVAALIVSSMGLRRDKSLIDAAPDSFSLEFPPRPEGDLELVFGTDGLDATVQSLLTLTGSDREVRIPLWFDLEQDRSYPDPEAGARSWHRVWIHRALVPPGTHRLFMRFRGIQPMTDGEAVVYFTDLWLRED